MHEYNQFERNFDLLLGVYNKILGKWNRDKLEFQPELKEQAMKDFYNLELTISLFPLYNHDRTTFMNEVRNKAHAMFGQEYFKNYNNNSEKDLKSRVEFLESLSKIYSFLHGAELGGIGMLIKTISDERLKEAEEGPWKEYFEKQHGNEMKNEILQELLKYVKNGGNK